MNGEGDPNRVKQHQKLVWGGVWRGVGRGIHNHPTPDAAQFVRKGQATTTAIAYPYAKLIPGSLTVDDHVHQLPG